MPDEFKPLLRRQPKSSLQDRTVDIKGTNKFNVDLSQKPAKTHKKEVSVLPQDIANKTAKVSPSTMLKISLIQSFVPQSELNSGKRRTINDTISQLVDLYVRDILTDRQKETFNQLYDMQYKDL